MHAHALYTKYSGTSIKRILLHGEQPFGFVERFRLPGMYALSQFLLLEDLLTASLAHTSFEKAVDKLQLRRFSQ